VNASEKDGALTVDIVVQPRASRQGVGPIVGDRLRVSVNAPPVDGAANSAVVETLSEALKVPRSAVEILRGETGRRKTVRIRGATLADLQALVDARARRS
jgi:uncharacterized protein